MAAALTGVVEVALLPPRRPPRREDGVGVRAGFASEVANRDWFGGGVANAEGVEDRRRLRRLASPGDEKVLPTGLEYESSGEVGPVKIGVKLTSSEIQ